MSVEQQSFSFTLNLSFEYINIFVRLKKKKIKISAAQGKPGATNLEEELKKEISMYLSLTGEIWSNKVT